jgi:hypothetical protein
MDDASYLPADGGGAINLWTHRPGDGHGTGLQRQAKLPRLGRYDRRSPVIDRPPKQETRRMRLCVGAEDQVSESIKYTVPIKNSHNKSTRVLHHLTGE